MQRPDLDRIQQGEKPIIKVVDFGISLITRPDLFEGKQKAVMNEKSGTSGYIAPEIKQDGEIVGPEIDMWAFGIILYEMCTAYKPNKL